MNKSCCILVLGVIYPHTREKLIKQIKEGAGGYYSIGLDESPHTGRNMFALVIRFVCLIETFSFTDSFIDIFLKME